jgi:hypothetical protein
MLRLSEPNLINRGAAYDWLKEAGGNPRFWTEPKPPQTKGDHP